MWIRNIEAFVYVHTFQRFILLQNSQHTNTYSAYYCLLLGLLLFVSSTYNVYRFCKSYQRTGQGMYSPDGGSELFAHI